MNYILKDMESAYDLLGNIIALYSSKDSRRMISIAGMCQHLLTAIEEERNAYNNFPEILSLIRKYVLEMYQILNGEKNKKVQKMGYETLTKLTRILP